MKHKPELSYNHKDDTFERDNERIVLEQAKQHWNNLDADWTVGAYNKMCEIVNNKNET